MLKEDEQEETAPALWTAMGKARTQNITKRSRTDLTNLLATVQSLNGREIAGMCKHVAEREHPLASKVSTRLVLNFMRALHRLEAHTGPHKHWLDVCRLQLDQCLLATWAGLRKDRPRPKHVM